MIPQRPARRSPGVLLQAVILLLLLPSGAAHAQAPRLLGLGARSAALANAVVADACDFSAAYYNPAGFVAAPRAELSFGYLYAPASLHPSDPSFDPTQGVAAGFVIPGRIGPLPFAVGLASYLPDSGLAHVTAQAAVTPRWLLLEGVGSTAFLAFGAAVRPLPDLEIGASMVLLGAMQAHVDIRGTANLIDAYDSALHHAVDTRITAVTTAVVGARLRLGPGSYLAVAYHSGAQIQLLVDARIHGQADFFGALFPLEFDLATTSVSAYYPAQIDLGTSLRPLPRTSLDLSVTFLDWSGYAGPQFHSTSRAAVSIPGGPSLGSPGVHTSADETAPIFVNRLVPHIGIEYRLQEAEDARYIFPLRAGYLYERSPLATPTALIVDTDRHVVALGGGIWAKKVSDKFPVELKVDVYGQASVYRDRLIAPGTSASAFMLGVGGTVTAAF